MEKNLKLQHLGLYIFFYKNILDFKINFNMEKFSIKSQFSAAGDQPSAINSLCSGIEKIPKIKSY